MFLNRRRFLQSSAATALACQLTRLGAAGVADRMRWYREAKFGMFIHWGPYSLAGVESFLAHHDAEWRDLGGGLPRPSRPI